MLLSKSKIYSLSSFYVERICYAIFYSPFNLNNLFLGNKCLVEKNIFK